MAQNDKWILMMSSNWVKNAINEINADHQRSADTHLIR
ncbi:PLP-dependent cysteine synthase family protein, partial [Salmonella enterica subsp. enterica]|nr:PLP-dependent cysteine synthase family protein [Salmonella enterica subsp. enterica serovar Chandans]